MISSRLSPKVEIRNKSLNGKGIFAKENKIYDLEINNYNSKTL